MAVNKMQGYYIRIGERNVIFFSSNQVCSCRSITLYKLKSGINYRKRQVFFWNPKNVWNFAPLTCTTQTFCVVKRSFAWVKPWVYRHQAMCLTIQIHDKLWRVFLVLCWFSDCECKCECYHVVVFVHAYIRLYFIMIRVFHFIPQVFFSFHRLHFVESMMLSIHICFFIHRFLWCRRQIYVHNARSFKGFYSKTWQTCAIPLSCLSNIERKPIYTVLFLLLMLLCESVWVYGLFVRFAFTHIFW